MHTKATCSWWVDAGTIVSGSSENALNGGHYYRNMRLPKESFNALVNQFRAKLIASKLSAELKVRLQKLKLSQSPATMNDVMKPPFVQRILEVSDGTESRMTVAYLKDVSLLFTLVSAVRERTLLDICKPKGNAG